MPVKARENVSMIPIISEDLVLRVILDILIAWDRCEGYFAPDLGNSIVALGLFPVTVAKARGKYPDASQRIPFKGNGG